MRGFDKGGLTKGFKVYTFLLYGASSSFSPLYIVLDSMSGSPKQSLIKIPLECTHFHGIVVNQFKIYVTVICTKSILIVVDIINNTFQFYESNSSKIVFFGINYSSSLSRILLAGSYSSTEFYLSKFSACCISQHFDIESFTYTVISESSSNIENIASLGISPTTYIANQYSAPISCTSNMIAFTEDIMNSIIVSYYLDAYNKDGLQSNVYYEQYIETTCTALSFTVITYSFVNYGGGTPPSWIQFNSTTSKLTFTVPRLATQTKFIFELNSVLGNGKSAIKPIYLTVEAGPPCLVSNCISCYQNYTDQCETCASNYSMIHGYKKKCTADSPNMDSTTKSSKIAIITGLSITVGAAVVMSLMNMSSITIVWAIFNQMRTLTLILLTDSYVTDNIRVYLSGMKVFSFNFQFLLIGSLSGAIKIVNYFDSKQKYRSISDSGFSSESTFVNCLNILVIYLLVISMHLILITESAQFILISAALEIQNFDVSLTSTIISLAFAIAFLVALVLFWTFTFIIWIQTSLSNRIPKKWHQMFDELFTDIKMNFWARGFSFISLMRTFLSVMLLIFSVNINFGIESYSVRVFILVGVQALYLLFILLIRPFKLIEPNLIHISNETIFLLISSALIYCNNEERWTSMIEIIYIQVITNSVFVAFFIVTAGFIIRLIKKCIKNKGSRISVKTLHPEQIIEDFKQEDHKDAKSINQSNIVENSQIMIKSSKLYRRGNDHKIISSIFGNNRKSIANEHKYL